MEAMARERYGLEIHAGPFGIDSRPALIGAKFAEAHGAGDAYHEAVFRAYWQHAQDISQVDTLAGVAATVGLDGEDLVAALAARQFEAQVEADLQQAFAYGLHAVPALVFNDSYLVSGAQPYPVLAQVADRVLAENGRPANRP